MRSALSALFIFVLYISQTQASPIEQDPRKFVQIEATTKEQRTQIATLGASIEAVRSDSVWAFADPLSLKNIKESGFKVLGTHSLAVARGGHQTGFDFPDADSRFHNYNELVTALRTLEQRNSDIVKVVSIGKSVQNRDILAVHINTSPEALKTGQSGKPGVIFMGTHHAREHISTEIPLMVAEHLMKFKQDQKIADLIHGRDIWIIPTVNPDGVEYDIDGKSYRMWRKNRATNNNGTFGVDLNRNYGFKWGTGGSSTNPSSDVYMGPAPFSEPESQAIKNLVDSLPNTKVLLSFHTFSELILYPWGNTYDAIGNSRDLSVFKKMAETMAQWNKYTPQQSSDLYIASGDTTDWAYGERGVFAFTFELSPKSMWDGGFYPGAGVIDKVFQDNLRPVLYMLEVADNPYKVIE